jgi:hypothetical protein
MCIEFISLRYVLVADSYENGSETYPSTKGGAFLD